MTRVKTHYLRDRDAGYFGRWPGARSDVIYTIMSDEQQRQRPKCPRPFRLQRKSPPGLSEGSIVLPIRSSPFSCPAGDFGCNAASEIMSFDPNTIPPTAHWPLLRGSPSAHAKIK